MVLYHNPQIPNLSVMCKVYTGYCGTSEIEHGLCAYTVDNPLAKARGLSLRTGAKTMLYLSQVTWLSRHDHSCYRGRKATTQQRTQRGDVFINLKPSERRGFGLFLTCFFIFSHMIRFLNKRNIKLMSYRQ